MSGKDQELIPENLSEDFKLRSEKAGFCNPSKKQVSGDLFIIDNSDEEWKALKYLREWCQISKSIDIATGFFEIGALLALDGEWQKVDKIRILMGFHTTFRTHQAIRKAREALLNDINRTTEEEKKVDDFLRGLPSIVAALKAGKIEVRVLEEPKFHAKAYITHGRLDVVGSAALVGSSNFTYPGLTQNIELNLRITTEVQQLQAWYEKYWELGKPATGDVLQILERHAAEYRPFDVYVKALEQFFLGHEPTATEWEKGQSTLYGKLARYQQDAYHNMLRIAAEHRGAFLCDGVGLGKTFVGMMLIERLHEVERRNIALFVPKAARDSVWERCLREYLPHIFGAFRKLYIFNHTDLNRDNEEIQRLLTDVEERADVIIVDEAHHFRNKGIEGKTPKEGRIKGEGKRKPSRYRTLAKICENKTVYLLTATPINNRLADFMNMIQLFSGQEQDDYFRRLGIHSLRGHFNKMDKHLDKLVHGIIREGRNTDLNEAEDILKNDDLFKNLVVQRSRKYVKESLKLSEETDVHFPKRQNPKVAAYKLSSGYEKLLERIDLAFQKQSPLFSLAAYSPLLFYKGDPTEDDQFEFNLGRQLQVTNLIRLQFLKRFESSVSAFEGSCATLLFKLYTFWKKQAQAKEQQANLEKWEKKHSRLLKKASDRFSNRGGSNQRARPLPGFEVTPDDEQDYPEDFVEPEILEDIELLDPRLFRVDDILKENEQDLAEVIALWEAAGKYRDSQDDKLQALTDLLKSEPSLKNHKVLIFTEFSDTARYLAHALEKSGIAGVEQVDGSSGKNKQSAVERFSPYYNRLSSVEIKEKGEKEIRVLISTDVLAEGLNLQDCTRLINYDIHWNPVRLMQRIGRIDRRLDLSIEERLLKDHPKEKAVRGTAAYWNFLPPENIDTFLRLFERVAKKTLKISKTQGIEGKQLLTEKDEYDALRDFNEKYEGSETFEESLRLKLLEYLRQDPSLEAHIKGLPGRLFSGKQHIRDGCRGVFLCYRLPVELRGEETTTSGEKWSISEGITRWYLYDPDEDKIQENPEEIHRFIVCEPKTPRKQTFSADALSQIRAKIETHIKNTYLKQVQAPMNCPKPELSCWMELS